MSNPTGGYWINQSYLGLSSRSIVIPAVAWQPAAPWVLGPYVGAHEYHTPIDTPGLKQGWPRKIKPRRKPDAPEVHPQALKAAAKKKRKREEDGQRKQDGTSNVSNKRRRSNLHSAQRRKVKAKAVVRPAAPPLRTTPELPVEILDRIFDYVFDAHEQAHRDMIRIGDRLYRPCERHPPFSILPLLLASRRFHQVAISFLYAQVTLNWRTSRSFCRQVPLEYCSFVKHLVYECDGNIEYARRGVEHDLKTLAARFACRNRRMSQESRSVDEVEMEVTVEANEIAMDTSMELTVERPADENKTRCRRQPRKDISGPRHKPLKPSDYMETAMPNVTMLTIRTIGQQKFGRIPKVARRSKYQCFTRLLDLVDPHVLTVEVDIRDPRFIMHAFNPLIKEYFDFYFGCLFRALGNHRRAEQKREKGILLDMDSWDLFDAKENFSQARQDRSNTAFHMLDDLAVKNLLKLLNTVDCFDLVKLVNFSDQFKRRLRCRMVTQHADRKYDLEEVEPDMELKRKASTSST